MIIKFNNTYDKLGESFYSRIDPTPVKNPELIHYNDSLARELGISLDSISPQEIAEIFSGNKILEGSRPIAQVYAGHQFGHFVPQLGDGRAILLGEVVDQNGNQKDIQLKGSGQTPYSRRGDGRAALGPMIREYVLSEAMNALGIKTTRSLAIVQTGEFVVRETLLPGAILTRVAASHLRIGTFEYFAARGDFKSLKLLADYAISRHYPQAIEASQPYEAFLDCVLAAQVALIVDWLRVGFIHGVMNTDNMSISGETIDYGPCAFMDHYHPNKVFSSIDRYGRYAFRHQADIACWNLVQLAQSLMPLMSLHTEEHINMTHKLIDLFKETFDSKWLEMMGQKIGILSPTNDDRSLIQSLLNIMQEDAADYTLTFRYLSYAIYNKKWLYEDFFTPSSKLKQWIEGWQVRIQQQNILPDERSLLKANPAFIPRNHMIENIIQGALKGDDFSTMHEVIGVLANPYEEQKEFIKYMKAPTAQECVTQTFCGT
jgi:uncharacterized protein YdiU (UPF0061 family)